MATILLTGGAGFIGSHLADAFLAAGHRLLVLDSLVTGRRENVPAGAEFLHRDLRDEGLEEILARAGVELVSHHAAQANVRVSVDDPLVDAQANILGSLRLVMACRRAGVRRLLFASSGGTVYGEQERFPCDESHPTRPTSPYGCAKLAVEQYLGAYGALGDLEPVVLRYANVYGPRQDPQGEAGIVAILAEKFLTGSPPRIFGDGTQTRDYVHVSDVVAANLALVADWRPGTYNVGTGIETSLNDLYALVARELGAATAPVHLPAVAAELARNSLDASRLAASHGWRPRLAFAEGLALTLPFYREKYAPGA
ncbi:MAG TPA: NAD-dependent epimerase/dehydratase family protein [Thermoanaerobaculia bacterium]|nr:NAD-dependent epimerase/dehydratase family protein [Thermoanaerobaculia bacterium]